MLHRHLGASCKRLEAAAIHRLRVDQTCPLVGREGPGTAVIDRDGIWSPSWRHASPFAPASFPVEALPKDAFQKNFPFHKLTRNLPSDSSEGWLRYHAERAKEVKHTAVRRRYTQWLVFHSLCALRVKRSCNRNECEFVCTAKVLILHVVVEDSAANVLRIVACIGGSTLVLQKSHSFPVFRPDPCNSNEIAKLPRLATLELIPNSSQSMRMCKLQEVVRARETTCEANLVRLAAVCFRTLLGIIDASDRGRC